MKFETYVIDNAECRIPIPESYKDCLELIRSDRFRRAKSGSLMKIAVEAILRPYDNCLVWLRLCAHRRGLLTPLFNLIKRVTFSRRCIDIPASTRIGFGLYIGHGFSIVINGGTIIGNNVNISQFLNIGTNHNTPAKIGNNVYIGPMVCIVEEVTVGSESTIGAGAVVTRDVPAGATVAGTPAKVLNTANSGRYITRPYIPAQ